MSTPQYPVGQRVAYDPKGQCDAMTDELGTVVGYSASGAYAFVDFDGDDLGAKAVAPKLLMPVTDAGEGPDLPLPDPSAENPRTVLEHMTTPEERLEIARDTLQRYVDANDGDGQVLAHMVLEQIRADLAPKPDSEAAVAHRGRTYLPVRRAERITQTTIEVALITTHLSGIHLPPGTVSPHGWEVVPAIVRYTGAEQ